MSYASIAGTFPRLERAFLTNCDRFEHFTDCLAPTEFVNEEIVVSSRPDLGSAPRVVSGGRALKSKEQFDSVLEPLADALGAGKFPCFEKIVRVNSANSFSSYRCLACCRRRRLRRQLAPGRPDW